MSFTEQDFSNWLQNSHKYDGGIKGYDDKGVLHLSVTDFCKSPQEIRLLIAYKNELPPITLKRSFKANIGTILHDSFENYFKSNFPHSINELRKEKVIEVEGRKINITGKVDMIDEDGNLYDLKTRSTYSNNKDNNYGVQGSLYKHILFPDLIKSDFLTLVNLWTNWTDKEENLENPITLEKIEFLSEKDTLLHIQTWIQRFFSEDLVCSSEERWENPTTYALQKPGSKRAYKVFSTKEEAQAAMAKHRGYNLNVREGSARKCEAYCPVAQFCPQHQGKGTTHEPVTTNVPTQRI